jgi:RNA polymerase sigma-70 factor (ECF subfamily)
MGATKAHCEATGSELLERACQGVKDAFYNLVCPMSRAVYVAVISILNHPADGRRGRSGSCDEGFANVVQFRGEAKFSAWLIQITINEARIRLRKDRRHLYESVDEHQSDEEGDYFPKDFADWREVPSETLERAELRQALKQAIAGWDPKCRDVVTLRDMQHLSTEETAQALSLSEGDVKTRLLRARLQTRDALTPGIDGNWTTGKAEYRKVRPWSEWIA